MSALISTSKRRTSVGKRQLGRGGIDLLGHRVLKATPTAVVQPSAAPRMRMDRCFFPNASAALGGVMRVAVLPGKWPLEEDGGALVGCRTVPGIKGEEGGDGNDG